MKQNKIKCENCIKERLKFCFDQHVIRQNDCWGWNGWIDRRGYPGFGHANKNISAHRASWMIYKGTIPDGLCVLHKCDNPICSNPEHLFLGTKSDNTKDMYLKGREGEGRFKKTKLTIEDIKEIKKLIKNGVKGVEICFKYNITSAYASNIKTGKMHKEIEPNE